ncbi:MAG: MmcQ/YjbR family DNA-binding protein [Aquamicrobium sp.]|uniref:MmcQ/YjbR family DNA-binding protein n=1 Tax=Aquamicrobium sp. TaxID=1872579 RepID=UPI00349EF967|nr:MmcQ/YjbR family DNA-binding protein [Aquamicrobium sp.]
MARDLGPAFERLKRAAAGLPEVEESTWYGTPALKVRGKGFCRVKDAETVVVMVALDEKEMLLQAAPDLYFETPHYRGWPAMLVRVHAIADDELAHRLRRAWLQKAPKALARQREG